MQPPTPPPPPTPPLPVIPLGYVPAPAPLPRRHAAKHAALAASFAWVLISPDGWRLLGACALFAAAFPVALRVTGAVTRVATWAACLLAASVALSLSALLVYGVADAHSSKVNYSEQYVVLPGWPIALACMSFLWLPAFLLILRRGGVEFLHDPVRREVVHFALALGLLFSFAHAAVFLVASAIGGYQTHVRTITSADGRFRAELYESHWLGETHYPFYLCEPSPAPMYGLRVGGDTTTLNGASTATLVPSRDGRTLQIRADNDGIGSVVLPAR